MLYRFEIKCPPGFITIRLKNHQIKQTHQIVFSNQYEYLIGINIYNVYSSPLDIPMEGVFIAESYGVQKQN